MKSGTHLVSNYVALMMDSQINIHNKDNMYGLVRHVHSAKDITAICSTHPHLVGYGNEVLGDCKLITCIRNPIDRAISLYYFVEKRKHTPRSLIHYIDDHIGVVIDEGIQMIDFSATHPDCLLLTFEECSSMKEKTILRIHDFARACLPINSHLSTKEVDAIVAKTNFEMMQSKEKIHGYKVGRDQPSLFHRSGQIKQWREHMSESKFYQLCEMIQERYKDIYNGIMSWEY